MRITVFAAGSRGDIQPCLAFCRTLQEAGYEICLAAPENFAAFIQSYAVPYHPLRGDVQQIMASETGKNFMERDGTNPIRSIRAMKAMLSPVVMNMAEDALNASRGSQGLVCLGVLGAFGFSIAQSLGIPMITIEPTPLLPTREFPAPSWPFQRNFGGLHNRLSGRAMLEVVWLWYQPFVNAFRNKLGLPKWSFSDFLHMLKSNHLIGAYSKSIIPHPSDWPESAHIVGYQFLEAQAGWAPSKELEAFLEHGDPPVYIGFGSMAGRSPGQRSYLVVEALKMVGARALLASGWGGMQVEGRIGNLFTIEEAPHSWLFPRVAAVVHHGGAGTTAEGLRAGVPAVILPFAFDQPFWGARIHSAGLGPEPVPQKKLTVERLAGAMHAALTDRKMRASAALVGQAIRKENGSENALRVVEMSFGFPGL